MHEKIREVMAEHMLPMHLGSQEEWEGEVNEATSAVMALWPKVTESQIDGLWGAAIRSTTGATGWKEHFRKILREAGVEVVDE